MKNIEQQQGAMKNLNLPRKTADQTKPVDESRRHFTKSGLAVSGVLLTLASRSALGGGLVCKSPSGFLSGNVSQHGTPVTCTGGSPGYWGSHTDKWPSPYLTGSCSDPQRKQDYNNWSNSGASSGTMFKDLALGFDCYGYGSRYKDYSMLQVILLGGSGDPDQLGAHIVAALLNAQMGWTPVLTESQVRGMFNEYASKGYFEPTAGVKWYPADIVTYLKSTMT